MPGEQRRTRQAAVWRCRGAVGAWCVCVVCVWGGCVRVGCVCVRACVCGVSVRARVCARPDRSMPSRLAPVRLAPGEGHRGGRWRPRCGGEAGEEGDRRGKREGGEVRREGGERGARGLWMRKIAPQVEARQRCASAGSKLRVWPDEAVAARLLLDRHRRRRRRAGRNWSGRRQRCLPAPRRSPASRQAQRHRQAQRAQRHAEWRRTHSWDGEPSEGGVGCHPPRTHRRRTHPPRTHRRRTPRPLSRRRGLQLPTACSCRRRGRGGSSGLGSGLECRDSGLGVVRRHAYECSIIGHCG